MTPRIAKPRPKSSPYNLLPIKRSQLVKNCGNGIRECAESMKFPRGLHNLDCVWLHSLFTQLKGSTRWADARKTIGSGFEKHVPELQQLTRTQTNTTSRGSPFSLRQLPPPLRHALLLQPPLVVVLLSLLQPRLHVFRFDALVIGLLDGILHGVPDVRIPRHPVTGLFMSVEWNTHDEETVPLSALRLLQIDVDTADGSARPGGGFGNNLSPQLEIKAEHLAGGGTAHHRFAQLIPFRDKQHIRRRDIHLDVVAAQRCGSVPFVGELDVEGELRSTPAFSRTSSMPSAH